MQLTGSSMHFFHGDLSRNSRQFFSEMPLRISLRRALHTLNRQSKPVNLPPPLPLHSSPQDIFLVDKAIAILQYHPPSLLNPLIPQFTPAASSELLLRSKNDKKLILKFLDWARELPFFSNQLQCLCLSIHILTRFKLYKTAQSLADEASLTFPSDEGGDLVFSCLADTYQVSKSSSAVFDLMVKALSNLKQIDRALNFVHLARDHGFMPSVLSYNSILEAIIRSSAPGCVEWAKTVFDEMISNDVSPNVFTYNILIRGQCANKSIDKGLLFFKEMERRGCLPNVVTYNTLIDAYCKMGNINKAYALLEHMWEKSLEPNVITYNVIVNGLCREGRMKETRKVLTEMKNQGLVPNEVTYNTLVNGYCKEGNFHQALVLHAEMVRNGLSPNVITYTSLIHSMCRSGNLRRAMEFFDQMRIRGLSPNEKTYTTLIDGFCQQGFMDDAYRLLNEMITKGFSPSIVTYNALINGHCVAGRIDNGVEVIKDMTAKGVCPDVVSYSTVISGLTRDSRLDEAFQMREEMIKKGISPDTITYSSLMQGLCAERRLTDAREMFEDMLKLGLLPDKCTYTTLINACCAEDDMDSALYLHNEMINKGFLPDVVTYSVLINGLNKQSRSKEAKRILFKLFYDDRVPRDVTYDLLIESCSSIEFQSGVALIKGFCLKGLMKEADRVFEAMLERNLQPSEAVYNVLIHGHCKARNLQKAIGLYREMVQYELVPHAVTIIALTKELHRRERPEEMIGILRHTLRSCKVIDGDPAKVLLEANYKEGNMDNVFHILQDMAKDGLLPYEFRTA